MLHLLAIGEKNQKQGFGTFLVTKLIIYAIKRDVKNIIVWADKDTIKFY